jgi:predicted nucleic acid-binding protein
VLYEMLAGRRGFAGEAISVTLALLSDLAVALAATHEEAMALMDRHHLSGTGLGWIDLHLLASAKLSGQSLWTADKRLRAATLKLRLAGPE